MRRGALVWATAGVFLLSGGAWLGGLRLNLTASLPVGLYVRIHRTPARGTIVLACLPPKVAAFARARRYVPRGSCPGGTAPVGKEVLAAAGDTVTVSPAGLFVNGAKVPNSRARPFDSQGRPLAGVPPGQLIVGRGELWIVAPHPLSFDSRYFGPIAAASVRAVVRPLWTAHPPEVRRTKFEQWAARPGAHLGRVICRKSYMGNVLSH